MNWADFKIAIAKGLVASAESVANIVSGVTKVGNADKLDGNDSSYFATKSSVTNITNGTTKVGNADKLDGLDSGSFPRYYTHATDYNGGVNGNKVDFNNLTQVGFHLMAGNFSESPNRPNGFYGDSTVIVTGNSACLTQIVTVNNVICFRKNAWNGDFGEWQYGGNADTLDGKHASDFLPITGGTLAQPNSVVLNIHNTAVNSLYSLLYFYANSVGLGALGFMGTNNPILYTTDGATKGLLHEGNSSKVIVSTTAPADTTAVWIVP